MSGGTSAAAGTGAAAGSTAAASTAAASAAVASSAAAASAAAAGSAAIAGGATAAAGGVLGAETGALFAAGDAAAAGTAGTLFTTQSLLALAGTGISALAQSNAAGAAKNAADYNSTIAGQAANAAAGAGERAEIGSNQQTALLLSRARSQAAGSGADTSSGSVISNETQIQGRGDLNAMTDLYNGESRASSLTSAAALQQFGAEQQSAALPAKEISTVMAGASSLYSRYSPNPFGGYQSGVA